MSEIAAAILGFAGGMVGGLLAPWTIPYILQAAGGNWNVPILVIAFWYFIGALAWLGVDPVTPLTGVGSDPVNSLNGV